MELVGRAGSSATQKPVETRVPQQVSVRRNSAGVHRSGRRLALQLCRMRPRRTTEPKAGVNPRLPRTFGSNLQDVVRDDPCFEPGARKDCAKGPRQGYVVQLQGHPARPELARKYHVEPPHLRQHAQRFVDRGLVQRQRTDSATSSIQYHVHGILLFVWSDPDDLTWRRSEDLGGWLRGGRLGPRREGDVLRGSLRKVCCGPRFFPCLQRFAMPRGFVSVPGTRTTRRQPHQRCEQGVCGRRAHRPTATLQVMSSGKAAPLAGNPHWGIMQGRRRDRSCRHPLPWRSRQYSCFHFRSRLGSCTRCWGKRNTGLPKTSSMDSGRERRCLLARRCNLRPFCRLPPCNVVRGCRPHPGEHKSFARPPACNRRRCCIGLLHRCSCPRVGPRHSRSSA